MELTFDHGRGYVSQEKNKQLSQPAIGVIFTDSIYTPVYNVSYKVENTPCQEVIPITISSRSRF